MRLSRKLWLIAMMVALCGSLPVMNTTQGLAARGPATKRLAAEGQAGNNLPADQEKTLAAISDIRRQLACYCGCSLTVEDCLRSMRCSDSAKLSQQVIDFLNSGKSKPEILQAMVASYGETILSAPTKKGFNLAAWILPFVMLGVGGVAAVKVIRKWRQQSSAGEVVSQEAATVAHAGSASDPYGDKVEEELRLLDK